MKINILIAIEYTYIIIHLDLNKYILIIHNLIINYKEIFYIYLLKFCLGLSIF
jgi:hypothetical protein